LFWNILYSTINQDLNMWAQYREIEKFFQKSLVDAGSKFFINPYLTFYLDSHKRKSAYTYKSKAIYVFEQFDYDSMIDEVKRLLKSEEEPPILKGMQTICDLTNVDCYKMRFIK
jgi:hypothetical protein